MKSGFTGNIYNLLKFQLKYETFGNNLQKLVAFIFVCDDNMVEFYLKTKFHGLKILLNVLNVNKTPSPGFFNFTCEVVQVTNEERTVKTFLPRTENA